MNRLSQQEESSNQEIIGLRYDNNEESLDLWLSFDSWKHLLNFRSWLFLKKLSLAECQIIDDDIKVLSRLQWPNLIELNLSLNHLITMKGIKILVENKWTSLQNLSLMNDNIGNEGMDLLLKAQIPNLSFLSVWGNKISARGMSNICNINIERIRILILSYNQIGSNGLKKLVKGYMPNLQQLQIQYCGLGDQGIHSLCKGLWPSMKIIKHSYNKLSVDGLSNNKLFYYPKIDKISSMEALVYISGFDFMGLEGKNTEVYLDIENWEIEEMMKRILGEKFYSEG